MRSSLKRRGLVKGRVYAVSAPCGQRRVRAGVKTQRPQRERGRMVLTVDRPGADWNEPVKRSRTNDAIRFRYVVVVQRLQCDAYGVGQGRASSAAGHPFARGCGHGAVRWQYAGSIRSATTPYGGQTS